MLLHWMTDAWTEAKHRSNVLKHTKYLIFDRPFESNNATYDNSILGFTEVNSFLFSWMFLFAHKTLCHNTPSCINKRQK